MRITKQVTTPSLIVFVADIQEAIKDGWTVDLENSPPYMYGVSYDAFLYKDVDEEAPVTRSRAEILADARAAKASKKDTKE